MSTRQNEDGVTVTAKGRGDRRFNKGSVGARTEPKFEHADVSLWKWTPEGDRYSLYLSLAEAYDLADSLDALLEWHEENEEGS